AVYVQTSRHLNLPKGEREAVIQTLRLAERLGGETVTLSGDHVSQEILDYARKRNVTKIIIGKPVRSRWKEWLFRSVASELVQNSGDIDIYVITGEAGEGRPFVREGLRRTSNWPDYGRGILGVAVCTVVAWMMFPYAALSNLIMVYLLGVVITAVRWGRGPSI